MSKAYSESPEQPASANKFIPLDQNIVEISYFEGDQEKALAYYSGQINRLTGANQDLSCRLKSALLTKKELADSVASFEEAEKVEEVEDKKKRVRRCANQIDRNYSCNIPGCGKSYGTEASMAQHMRLKHPEVEYRGENSHSNS